MIEMIYLAAAIGHLLGMLLWIRARNALANPTVIREVRNLGDRKPGQIIVDHSIIRDLYIGICDYSEGLRLNEKLEKEILDAIDAASKEVAGGAS